MGKLRGDRLASHRLECDCTGASAAAEAHAAHTAGPADAGRTTGPADAGGTEGSEPGIRIGWGGAGGAAKGSSCFGRAGNSSGKGDAVSDDCRYGAVQSPATCPSRSRGRNSTAAGEDAFTCRSDCSEGAAVDEGGGI